MPQASIPLVFRMLPALRTKQ